MRPVVEMPIRILCPNKSNVAAHRPLLRAGASIAVLGGSLLLAANPGFAQGAATPNIVGACSGVSLPRSVVTGILAPVVTGVVTPVQNTVNPVLGVVGAVLPGVPPLSIDAAGLLADAAAGDPITLQMLNANGTIVGPDDRCDLQSDSLTLRTPAGIAIGGNRITGLGAAGQIALAGEANSIAFGNAAATDASAAGSIAIGTGSAVGANATGALALGTGAGATAVNGVALGAGSVADRAPLAGYAALGLAGTQTSVGAVSVGAVGAERQITNVAAGTAATDAATVGQVAGVAAQVTALGTNALQYDDATKATATLGGAGGTRVTNVAAGTIAAGSTDAVNGAQLAATNAQVGANTTAITNLGAAVTKLGDTITNLGTTIANGGTGPVQYSDAATPTTPNGGVRTNDLTLVGAAAAPVGLHNVAAGTLAAGSTDAVNGAQLYTTNQNVTAAQGTADTALALGTNSVQYGPGRDTVTFNPGGAATVLGNVGAGAIAAGSTEAVNGGQIYGLALTAVNAVAYDTDAAGMRTNRVTLAGGDAAAPVTIGNVAAGTLAAGSTEAVNGGQLFTTNQAVATAQGTADTAIALGNNSVQYGPGRTNVTFNTGGAATVLSNVAAGTSATDAANVGQLAAGLGATLNSANAYTDTRIAALNFDVGKVRRAAFAGSSGALAAAGLPQPYEAGKGMIALGAGTYGGQSAVALGVSKAFNDGRTVMKLGGSYDTQGRVGASGGVGYQF